MPLSQGSKNRRPCGAPHSGTALSGSEPWKLHLKSPGLGGVTMAGGLRVHGKWRPHSLLPDRAREERCSRADAPQRGEGEGPRGHVGRVGHGLHVQASCEFLLKGSCVWCQPCDASVPGWWGVCPEWKMPGWWGQLTIHGWGGKRRWTLGRSYL